MFVRLGYRYDEYIGVNRITYYILLRNNPQNLTLRKNELVFPLDDLPPDFISCYKECEVKDGRVQWCHALHSYLRYGKA